MTTSKMIDKRITVRLTEDDERTLKSLKGLLRPRFPWLNTVDIVRTALHEAERALSAEQQAAGR
jgi:hypothetical protein